MKYLNRQKFSGECLPGNVSLGGGENALLPSGGQRKVGWVQIGFDGKVGKKNEWFLFLIYLFHHPCTSILTNCTKGQRTVACFSGKCLFCGLFLYRLWKLEMSEKTLRMWGGAEPPCTGGWILSQLSRGSSRNEKSPGKNDPESLALKEFLH